ncbi:MAG: hypothetical protein ACK56I_12115, partial [bacterium]
RDRGSEAEALSASPTIRRRTLMDGGHGLSREAGRRLLFCVVISRRYAGFWVGLPGFDAPMGGAEGAW